MSGFENHDDGTAQEITVTDTESAAKAIEGFLDEGPETNPAQGQQGAAEAPAPGEEIEQFGQEFDNPAEPQPQEAEQAEAEQQPLEEETGQELEEDSPLYAVTVQGEEKLVPLEDLTKGYMLQSDYTKKTQHLAQEREQFVEQANAVLAERKQYVELLTALEEQLNNGGEVEPDWVQLSENDPAGYVRTREAWNQKQEILNAARTERERVTALQQQEFAQKAAAYAQEQQALILKAKPELKDPAKAQEYRDSLVNYGTQTYGYTAQDLNAITDHRMALILEKAMLYDQATQKGGIVQKQIKGKKGRTRQVIRPGAAQSKPVVRERQDRLARERLERTGDIRDAADAMANLL